MHTRFPEVLTRRDFSLGARAADPIDKACSLQLTFYSIPARIATQNDAHLLPNAGGGTYHKHTRK